MDSRMHLVACIGNLLLKDEGFGPYMARVLTEFDVASRHFDEVHANKLTSAFRLLETDYDSSDERIPVLDAGTMGMSMIPYIRDYDEMVIVDVVDCGPSAQPGTCFVFSPEEMAENCIMHSLHDMRIPDVLTNARLAGHDCAISCVGVQMKDISPKDLTIGLTSEVETAVPYAVQAIVDCLGLDI